MALNVGISLAAAMAKAPDGDAKTAITAGFQAVLDALSDAVDAGALPEHTAADLAGDMLLDLAQTAAVNLVAV